MDFYASSSGEEEELGAVNFALSREASLLFQAKKYSDCLDILNQLLLKKPHDPKVLHNIAITKYFCGGCSDPKTLLDELIDVKRKCKDQALALVSLLEAIKIFQILKTIEGWSIKLLLQVMQGGFVRLEYFIPTLFLHVQALICYHLHDYSKALSVLEPIYQNIESIDEKTALIFAFCCWIFPLLLRMLIDMQMYLVTWKKLLHPVNVTTETWKNMSPLNTVSRRTPILTVENACISDAPPSMNSSDDSLSKDLSEEANDYENLLLTLDIGGVNLERSTRRFSSRTSADWSIPSTDQLSLQLHKVRFLLLTRSLKIVESDVNKAMNLAQDGNSTIALLLRAQFEYARGNYSKSLNL